MPHLSPSCDGSPPPRHLDAMVRDRLGLPASSRLRPRLALGVMAGVDRLARLLTGTALFEVRGTRSLLVELDGLSGPALVRKLLSLQGGTAVTSHGAQHVPRAGGVVIASTHPTGMLDYVLHAAALLHHRPDLKVVANRETAAFLGAEAIIPVTINRQNRAEAAAEVAAGMRDHLQDGGALLIFGSGRVPHCRAGLLEEPRWRSGASRISREMGVPLIPAGLNARNSRAYYRLRSLGEWLSRGDDDFGAMVGSMRYSAELLAHLGGRFEVHYGPELEPGTAAPALKAAAEGLVPGLYAPVGSPLGRF